jgi:hypothetical protein
VAGKPIPQGVFIHWMHIAALGAVASKHGTPAIDASDPPGFENCIAQVRQRDKTLAHAPASQIKTDCEQLFKSLSHQVMSYLITADWYLADAARRHVAPSQATVFAEFKRDERKTFKTSAAFERYIRQTGQTPVDSLFRVRVSLADKRLVSALHGAKAVNAEVRRLYLKRTLCAAIVMMEDCGKKVS